LELKQRLDSTLNFRQGFSCATTTKLEPLQVANYKMRVVSTFTMRGVFIGVNGTSTNLERSVSRQVVAGGQATWSAGWKERPPPTWTSPPCVDVWQPRLRPNHLKPWLAGRPLVPLGLGSGSVGPRVKYTLMVMMNLKFGQLHFVIP
jgi:hypothetical protein